MRVSECVECEAFPCADVKHNCHAVPGINLKPEAVSIVRAGAVRVIHACASAL